MKEFRGKGEISHLSLGTKFVYSCFLLFCLCGLLTMIVMTVQRSGFSSLSGSTYVLGDEGTGIYGKSSRELLEITHFHLFSVPVLLLILSHLFMLCSLKFKVKAWVSAAAFLGGIFYVAGPWVIYALGTSLAPYGATVGIFGRLLLFGSILIFCLVPLHEFWIKPRESKSTT